MSNNKKSKLHDMTAVRQLDMHQQGMADDLTLSPQQTGARYPTE